MWSWSVRSELSGPLMYDTQLSERSANYNALYARALKFALS
jgi:hypothetical protein